jgi:thioredoxin-related protein
MISKFKLLTVLMFSVWSIAFLGLSNVQAQSEPKPADYPGVIFEEDLDWKEILAKAKASNKHIFVDFYTTWCGPCKHIDKNVFPTEEAGKYFNERFVNVKIQLDKTPKDAEHIKRWYAQADSLGKAFEVKSLPTFVVFDPNGNPLHRIIGAGDSIHLFIGRIDESFDTSKQYYRKLAEAKADTSIEKLKKLALDSKKVSMEKNAILYSNLYLEALKGVYTQEDLLFAREFNMSDSGMPFKIFLNDAKKVNRIMGIGFAEVQALEVITKQDFYNANLYKDSLPDWKAIRKAQESKYGWLAKQAYAKFRVEHAVNREQWDLFEKLVNPYFKKYLKKTSPGDIVYFSSMVVRHTGSRKLLKQAQQWMQYSMSQHIDYTVEDSYAALLYKLGKVDEALALQKKVVNDAHEYRKPYFQKHLDAMEAGKPLWKVDLRK